MIPEHILPIDHSIRFIESFNAIERIHNKLMQQKGFWDSDNPQDINHDIAKIGLMHGELSEAMEGVRHGNPPDDKVSQFSSVEAELADTILRIMDFAAQRGYKVSEALIAKMHVNYLRPRLHGKQA